MQIIHLYGDVDEDLVKQFYIQLETCLNNSTNEIKVFLSTGGGDVYCGYAIYDGIRSCQDSGIPVTIIATGSCMSAGSMIILQAADKRLATENCTLMVHFGEETNESTSDVKQNSKVFKQIRDLLIKRTGRPSRTVSGWFKRDTYFDAKEALNKGLIDGITDVAKALKK